MKKILVALFVSLAAAPILAQTATDTIRPVKLIMIEPRQGSITRQFFGQVVARQTVDLAFQVAGQIVEFPAIEGQEISQGGLVARLDLEPFTLARDQARVQLDQAERTLTRLQQLSGTAVSQVAVDDAETQVQLAKINLRNTEFSLEHATLIAPFDGLVAERNVANFTTVSAGQSAVRMHDMSELRVEIDVPEILFQRAGADPSIKLMAKFPTSDTLYPLEPREFDAQASEVGQTFRITLGMERPENINVFPGSSVTVITEFLAANGGPIIPTSAIRAENDGTTSAMVFVPSESDQGVVERRVITVEPTRDGAFALKSGLEIGEEIVLTGVAALNDGQTVRRFTGFRN